MSRGGLEPGTVIDGRYEVQRPLGEGGMGAVFVVRHLVTKHLRALKVLHAEYASHPEIIERFLREASAAGRIGNEHVVETFDGGRLPDGEAYLVMELLEGRSLRDELAQHPEGLPLSAVRRVMRELCDGVEAAHEAGIVHRDLKPENVFLARRKGAAELVKVLDFGISKFEREATSLTQTGGALGTPLYMAPEQLERAKDVTPACDVYALGVIAFECLTGKHPYPADSMAALVRAIVLHVPPAPSTLRRGLSSTVDEVVLHALEKQPAARPRSPRAFAEALTRALDDDDARLGSTLARGASLALDDTAAASVTSRATSTSTSTSTDAVTLAALELHDTVAASAAELPRLPRPEETLQPASTPRADERRRTHEAPDAGAPQTPAVDARARPRRVGLVAVVLGLSAAGLLALAVRGPGGAPEGAASASAPTWGPGLGAPSHQPSAPGASADVPSHTPPGASTLAASAAASSALPRASASALASSVRPPPTSPSGRAPPSAASTGELVRALPP